MDVINLPTNSPRFKPSPGVGSTFWDEIVVDLKFSIIGAPKCATTWLCTYLNSHPDIFLPGEQNFFTLFQSKGTSYFNSLYKNSTAKCHGDHSNTNMLDHDLPLTLAKKYPGMKLIIVCRNPVERAFSHYLMDVLKGTINPQEISFYDALFAPVTYSYYDLGLYSKHIKRYLEYFKKESLLVLLQDDIRDYPEKTMSKVFQFLDLPPTDNLPKTEEKNTWYQRKVEAHPLVFFIRGIAKSFIPKRFYSPVKQVWFSKYHLKYLSLLSTLTGVKKPSGPDVEKGKTLLRNLYYPSNRELELVMDRDLSAWDKS